MIPNSPKWEATQMAITWRMGKQTYILYHVYNGVLFQQSNEMKY